MGRSIRCKSLEWVGFGLYDGLYDDGDVQIFWEGYGFFCIGRRTFVSGLDGYQSERLLS
jgi:hypothetical protein